MADIIITAPYDDEAHFDVSQGGSQTSGLSWDEMLGTVASLTHPEISQGLYGMRKPARPAVEATPVSAVPKQVTITLPIAEAHRLSEGMADLLCWVRGFIAATPDKFDAHPMGVEGAREMRIALRRALADAEGKFPPETEMPF